MTSPSARGRQSSCVKGTLATSVMRWRSGLIDKPRVANPTSGGWHSRSSATRPGGATSADPACLRAMTVRE